MYEPERTPEYRKDPAQEERLKHLNTLMAPLEGQLISGFDQPRLPIVFIVGAPRSGSTLLSQTLAQTGAFSYVSNFVARFWMAPYVGTLIEDALGIRKLECDHSFVSRFGVTEGWAGPHEFGYFWSRWFRFGETHQLDTKALEEIDLDTLQKELAALESVYNKPLCFKYLPCGLHIPFLAEHFENSIFVLCRRQSVYNMQSLLLARSKIFGDEGHWWSLRPKEYPDLLSTPGLGTDAPYEQVAGQIYYTLKEIETSLSSLSPERFLHISYHDLCSQPRAEVNRVVETVNQIGVEVDWKPDLIPARFKSTDTKRISDEEFQKLRKVAKRYFGADNID